MTEYTFYVDGRQFRVKTEIDPSGAIFATSPDLPGLFAAEGPENAHVLPNEITECIKMLLNAGEHVAWVTEKND